MAWDSANKVSFWDGHGNAGETRNVYAKEDDDTVTLRMTRGTVDNWSDLPKDLTGLECFVSMDTDCEETHHETVSECERKGAHVHVTLPAGIPVIYTQQP